MNPMTKPEIKIRPFQADDENGVIKLWTITGLTRPWNDPKQDIKRALSVQPELFLVAVNKTRVIGSAMGGYDGHRGAVYYLAVHPDCQSNGIGTRLMQTVEDRLVDLGCPKIHVMIRETNLATKHFYEKLEYQDVAVKIYGRRLIADVTS